MSNKYRPRRESEGFSRPDVAGIEGSKLNDRRMIDAGFPRDEAAEEKLHEQLGRLRSGLDRSVRLEAERNRKRSRKAATSLESKCSGCSEAQCDLLLSVIDEALSYHTIAESALVVVSTLSRRFSGYLQRLRAVFVSDPELRALAVEFLGEIVE